MFFVVAAVRGVRDVVVLANVDRVYLELLDVLLVFDAVPVLEVHKEVDLGAEPFDLLPREVLGAQVCRVVLALDLVDLKELTLDEVLDVQGANLEVLHLADTRA